MKRTLALALTGVGLAMALHPARAAACAVCFAATEENRMAFLATTAILSLLPLGMIGGVGAWLRRRSREIEAEQRERDGAL